MTNFIEKDKNRRRFMKKQELERVLYKTLIHDFSIDRATRFQYMQKLNRLPRNGSLTRVRNRCLLTGRGRAVFRFCKLSRIVIRQLAAQGLLLGIHKSSW